MYEVVIQTLVIIGSVLGVAEWRFRVVHGCIHRVEKRFEEHVKRADQKISEFDELKGKLEK